MTSLSPLCPPPSGEDDSLTVFPLSSEVAGHLRKSTAAIQPSSFLSDINECASSPCLNGGTCVDEVSQFSCVCGKGWSGPTCQTPLPTCKQQTHNQTRWLKAGVKVSTALLLVDLFISPQLYGDMYCMETCPLPAPFSPVFITMTNMSEAAAASTLPAATAGAHVRPSRCTITQGTTHCTCEPGYTISGRDSSVCTGVSPTFFLSFFLGSRCWPTVHPSRYRWVRALP